MIDIQPTIQAVSDAVDTFARRSVVPSAWRTAEWSAAPEAIAQRSFFSAGVESATFLSAAKTRLDQALTVSRDASGAGMDRERFIRDARQTALQLGLADPAGKPTDLKNLAGATRLGMIYDMNVNAAYGRARRSAGLSKGALFAAPAQQLVRGRAARVPRDWRALWKQAGENVAWEGAIDDAQFIALKTSPIWTELSRFRVPWPPFDFGSGMVLRDISRDRAIALGLIAEDEILDADPDPDFNQALAATLQNVAPQMLSALKSMLGDLVNISGNQVKFA
jgi:hypothetical protein